MFSKILSTVAYAVAVYAIYLLCDCFSSRSRHIPGPFLAKFSRLWYFSRVCSANFEKENIELHRKYGRIVRLAPNMYSIDDPATVGKIYGATSKMPKSDWYDGFSDPFFPKTNWNPFVERDIKKHAEIKRSYHTIYSTSSLLSYEGLVDSCTDLLTQRFDEFTETGEKVDLMHWFQCYGYDVIGNITFSKRFRFLDNGEDRAGLMAAIHNFTSWSAIIGIIPELRTVSFLFMVLFRLGGATGRSYFADFITSSVRERLAVIQSSKQESSHSDDGGPTTKAQDFIEKLLIQREKHPERITDYHFMSMAFVNVGAGADTTALSLSAVMYYLCRNPGVLSKLRKEVDECGLHSHFEYTHAQKLPYLQATIKEALRLHAGTALPLWREVDDQGLTVDGFVFPKGSVVGINTWVAHYNEEVFGKDAADFRPERWIDAQQNDPVSLKRMNNYYLPVSIIPALS